MKLATLLLPLVGCMGIAGNSGDRTAAGTNDLSATNVIHVVGTGKCIDISGASTSNGAALIQSSCNGRTSQQWTLRSVGSNTYRLSAASSGKCMDVSGASTADGAAIIQWPCHSRTNQQWLAVDAGGGQYELHSVGSGKCLDARASALAQWTCNGGDRQRLTFAPVGSTGGGGQQMTVNLTSYGFNDNDDGSGHYGTATIAYPQIHNQAHEGSGAFDDPITFATDANELAPGTIVYVPYLQKYFIMEDGCVECTDDWRRGVRHIDLWMGPASLQPEPALDDCEGDVTRTDTIFANAGAGYPVDTTPMFSSGRCTVRLH